MKSRIEKNLRKQCEAAILCFLLIASINLGSLLHKVGWESLFRDIKIQEASAQEFPFCTPIACSPTPVQNISEQAQSGFCLTVPIILYHRIQPYQIAIEKGQQNLTVDNAIFEGQMQYLAAQNYHAISSEELVNALKNKQQLPAKSIIVTFDDGYKDHFDYVYPILQKYNIKGEFMIPTGLIETLGYMSWQDIEAMAKSPLVSFTNHTFSHFPVDQGSSEKVREEVTTARKQLQEHIGKDIAIFTYPYGSFNDMAINELRLLGFVAALTTNAGRVQCDSNLMKLFREHVGNAPLSSYGL